jgi:hypothetical protein
LKPVGLTPAAEIYIDLWNQLDALWRDGKGESKEADDLRDKMDGPWRALSGEEIPKVHAYLAELDAQGGRP